MVTKNKHTKNNQSQVNKIESYIAHVGLTAMSIATVTSLVHMYEARGHKADPTHQTSYSHVIETANAGRDAMRRERDEIRHMSISYGASMRSHPTAGTI